MHEHKQKLAQIALQLKTALNKVDLPQIQKRISNLTGQTQNPGFWNNQEKAQTVSQELSWLQKELNDWTNLQINLKALQELAPTIDIENDPESAKDFKKMVDDLEKSWKYMEIKTFFKGKYDSANVILSIHAGTGGKDAMDFVNILLRMYLRYCENNKFITEILDQSVGEEVGIKSVTVEVKGTMAYGYLKNEKGVHRLVRNSPFNAKNSRETSFALVEVMPDISNEHHVEINSDDLKIDTFRSSGAGGQNVNKVSSAVRITHLPTNIVVTCQSERSQYQNKERALKILTAKLIELAEQQQVEELSKLKGGRVEMSWGNQIRSYILQPYTLVKDHRTNYEEHNVDAVLDGHIEGFIEAKLKS